MERETVEDLLDILEIPISSVAYNYITEAVLQQIKEPEEKVSNIYKIIRKNYQISEKAIDERIRQICKSKEKFIQKYFNINYKITNKTFISLLAREIQKIVKWG